MAFTTHGHQIEGSPAQPRPAGMLVVRCGGPVLCSQCSKEAADWLKTNEVTIEPAPTTPPTAPPEEFYNEETLRKVYDVLWRTGHKYQESVDLVTELLNVGILFRERSQDAT